MKRTCNIKRRLLPILLSIVMGVSLFSGHPLGKIDAVEAGTVLNNPRVMKDASLQSGQKVTYDCVWFGNYFQTDKTGTTKEPIKWRVLSINGTDAFLLSDTYLDTGKYNDTVVDSVTWENCSMRSWLNGYGSSDNICGTDFSKCNFMDEAFTSSEQEAIKLTAVLNEDNSSYGTDGGNNTKDKLFLLSYDEVTNPDFGFSSDRFVWDEARKIGATEYVKNKTSNGWWLLRSPGFNSYTAMNVYDTGYVSNSGEIVYNSTFAVCPALHLDLSQSELWSYAGTVCSDGTMDEKKETITDDTTNGTIKDGTYVGILQEVNDSDGTVTIHDTVYPVSKDYNITNASRLLINYNNPQVEYIIKNGRVASMILKKDASGLSEPIYNSKEDVATWDCIYFGRYYQTYMDGYLSEDEIRPIKWRVLSLNGDDAFLVSDKIIWYGDYWHESPVWSNSQIRSWLNGYSEDANTKGWDYSDNNFIDDAFTDSEQEAIYVSSVKNDEKSYGGADTSDKIYLLSEKEASNEQYGFHGNLNVESNTRFCEITSETNGFTASRIDYWTLRTPSSKSAVSMISIYDGTLYSHDVNSGFEWGYPQGVRPCIHLNLSDDSLWSYAGTVSSDGTENSIEFTIRRDNNAYYNSDECFFSQNETQNYMISNSAYLDQLLNGMSGNRRQKIINHQRDQWNGACYGIALSMLYCYMGDVDYIQYMNDSSIDDYLGYYNLVMKNNQGLRDFVHVLQLAQYRSDTNYTHCLKKSDITKGANILSPNMELMHDFLKNLVRDAKGANYLKPLYIGALYKTGGHALLVCGYKGMQDGKHVLDVCDPNNQSQFIELYVEEDYSRFKLEGYEGKIDSASYKQIMYSSYDDLFHSRQNVEVEAEDNSISPNLPWGTNVGAVSTTQCVLNIPVNSSCYISFDDGSYLVYDGDTFEGNAKVVNLDCLIKGEGGASEWELTIEGVTRAEFSQLSSNVSIDFLMDTDDYYSVVGTGISNVILEQDKGVTITGKDATYNIAIGMEQDENEVLSVSGTCNEKVETSLKNTDVMIQGVDNWSDIDVTYLSANKQIQVTKKEEYVTLIDREGNIMQPVEVDEGETINNGGNQEADNTEKETIINQNTGKDVVVAEQNENKQNDNQSNVVSSKKDYKISDGKQSTAVGTKLINVINGMQYIITSNSGTSHTASFVGCYDKCVRQIMIPDTITYQGITFKITGIAAKACKNQKYLQTITIGKNIKIIGTQAFYGCKSLKTIKVKTKSLTGRFIGAKAFTKAGSRNYKKLKVKVPAKKKQKYKKLFRKKGLSHKAKVTR